MQIQRKTTKVSIGLNRVRYITKLYSAEAAYDGDTAQKAQSFLLESIVSQPLLMRCGPVHYFDSFTLKHDGFCWVVTIQVEVDESTGG